MNNIEDESSYLFEKTDPISPNSNSNQKNPNLIYQSKGVPPSRILNQDFSKEELTCACCLMIVWESICCGSCEAHFCNICILEWLKRQNNSLCPTCQCEFDSHPIPRISKNLLSKLRISCIYEVNGCKEQIEYNNLYIHETDCLYRKERCQNKGCELELTLLELKTHKDECPHLIVACRFCKDLLKQRDREAHELECPYRKMLCCYDNCGELLIAMDYERHLLECGFRPINCDFCQKSIIQKDLDKHKENCEERPAKCRGCGVDLKLKELKIHENECELIEIVCEICEKSFLKKDKLGHDKMTCFESAVIMFRKVLEIPLKDRSKLNPPDQRVALLENSRLDFLQRRLEQQSNEIILLKKELVSLQMANLTDSKLNVYSIHYPSDLAHKSIIIPECISYKRANSFQQQIASAVVQDLKLLKTKTSELSFPENISIKKHNYMSLCALNENLLIIGDDLGRLLLWDLVDDRELAFVHIKSGLEIKALALFSYDSSQSLEELYHMIPQNEKNEITAISLLGFWVISGHGSGALYIWDIELYKEENSGLLSAKFKKVSQMNVSSPYKISSILDLEDQIHFITSSYGKNNQIEIWDCLSDYKVCSIEKPHKDTISKLALLEKRNRFISASDDGTLRIWRVLRGPNNNLQSPQCEKTINLNEPIWSLGVLPNGRLIVALNNHNIEIYDLNTKERVRQIENKDEGDSGGLVGDFLVIEEAIEEGLENVLVMALHKERIVVYDGNLKVIGMIKQTQNEFKWGFLASHLMQILVARRLERKEGGNLVKIAVLGQKGKKVSVVELTIF